MSNINITTLSKSTVFHFIGIDGIGMSSIAGTLLNMGFKVQGSNNIAGENMTNLAKNGATVWIGHNKDHIKNADYVIYSDAIPEDNIELIEAKNIGIRILDRSSMLGELFKTKTSIAVTGTHGKTTTTSFIGILLDKANLDPTIINGGVINKYNSHYKLGNGNFIVAEACEAFGNIKNYTTDIAIITNIDPEHLEYYKTFETEKKYFTDFIERIPQNGLLVACIDHPTIKEMLENINKKINILTYGIENKNANIQATNIIYENNKSIFDVLYNGAKFIENLELPLLGNHNILNSLSSIALAIYLNIDKNILKETFKEFTGTKHRFSLVDKIKDIKIYDDYAHHPTEIKSTLSMARIVAKTNKIFTIFQPHRYSRLNLLWQEFLNCFNTTDYLIITPIYSAGETKDTYKDSNDFYEAIKQKFTNRVFVIQNFKEIQNIITSKIKNGDLIISFGAGDIKNFIYTLPNLLKEKLTVV